MNTSNLTFPLPPSYTCPFQSALLILYTYAIPALSVFGVLTNTYGIAVFALILRYENTNGHMFKYLLLKAVHDTIQFIIQSFAPLRYCTSCPTWGTYAEQVWSIYFYFYVECINELCSGLFEVAATFDCLINLNMKLQCCKKNIVFYITSAVLTICPCLFYTFVLYEFDIVQVTRIFGNVTLSYYIYEYTSFAFTYTGSTLFFVHGIVRDVVLLVILLIMNMCILFTMKRSFRNKRRLTTASEPSARNQVQTIATVGPSIANRTSKVRKSHAQQNTAANDAERNVIIMIVFNGLNYFAGHVFAFLKYCVFTQPSVVASCVEGTGLIVFYWSYVGPFFIYFSCNKLFRQYAMCGRRGGLIRRSGQSRPAVSVALSRHRNLKSAVRIN